MLRLQLVREVAFSPWGSDLGAMFGRNYVIGPEVSALDSRHEIELQQGSLLPALIAAVHRLPTTSPPTQLPVPSSCNTRR